MSACLSKNCEKIVPGLSLFFCSLLTKLTFSRITKFYTRGEKKWKFWKHVNQTQLKLASLKNELLKKKISTATYVLCTNYEATNIMTKIPNLFETTSLMMMMLLKRKLLQQNQELSLNTYLTLETWPLNYLYFSTPTKYFSHTSLHIIQNVSRRGKENAFSFCV